MLELHSLSNIDEETLNTVKQYKGKNISARIHWSTRAVKPISESSDTKIFCLAFPWFFPGGIGI